MPTMSRPPAVHARQLTELGDQMHRCDQELFQAERGDDRTTEIAVLFERSGLWRRYADLLTEAGQDVVAALVASRRDHDDALNLQAAAARRATPSSTPPGRNDQDPPFRAAMLRRPHVS